MKWLDAIDLCCELVHAAFRTAALAWEIFRDGQRESWTAQARRQRRVWDE